MRKGLKPRPPPASRQLCNGTKVGREDLSLGGCQAALARIRDIETIDSELQLMAGLGRAARERGGPLPSIDVGDAPLDERREVPERVRN